MVRGGVESLGGARQTPLFCLLGSIGFWTWRINVLMVTVCMHTETT